MDTENTGTESTQEEAGAQAEVETTPEGAQPSEETVPTPAPEQPESEPSIPYSRFQEVLRERNQLRDLARQQTTQPASQAAPVSNVGMPKQEDFTTYEDYIDARAEFKAAQATRAIIEENNRKQSEGWRQQQEQTRESKAGSNFLSKWNAEVSKDATLKTLPTDPLMEMPKELALMVMESDNAGPLAAHLLKNPAIAYELHGLSPMLAAKRLGQIEGKLSGSTRQPPQIPSKNIPSIDPVRTGTGKGSKRGDEMSQDDVLRRLYPH